MAYIVKHLQTGELTHVRNCETVADMWDALEAFYDLRGAIEIANAEVELTAIIMGEAEDLGDYAKRLQELHDRLGHLGEPVKPAKQTINFLNSLNTRYSARVESVMSWAISAPTLFTIPQAVSTLSAGDRREVCNDRKRGVLPGGQQANFVGKRGYSGSSGAGPSRPSGSGGPGSRDLTRVQCYGCNLYGHKKST